MTREFIPWTQINPAEVSFALKAGYGPKASDTVVMLYGSALKEVAFTTPACITNWPRVNGDGNYGTMWGPQDIQKAKYTLDLTDVGRMGETVPCEDWTKFADVLTEIDNRLLDFVHTNQQRLLNRRNLSLEEVKMLQIRSVRPKHDKLTGQLLGHAFQMSTSKFQSDGMGGRFERDITICDHTGKILNNAVVQPGDLVAATCYGNQVYTGVGGDKFGIHWSFQDVAIICQRVQQLSKRTSVCSFEVMQYQGQPYHDIDLSRQFPEDYE